MKGVTPAQIIQALLHSPKHLKELAKWPDEAVGSAFLGYDVRFIPVARTIAGYMRQYGRAPDVSVLRSVYEEENPTLYEYKVKAVLDEVEIAKVSPALREHILAKLIRQLRLNLVLAQVHSTTLREKAREGNLGGVLAELTSAIKGLKSTGSSQTGEVDPFAAYKSFAAGVEAVREEGDPTYFHMFIPGAVHSLAGASEAGKSSLAWWLAAHWATGEAPFAQWKPKDANGYPNPDRCRMPAMGFAVYVGRDLDGRELQRKAARFGNAGLTATTRLNPCAKPPEAMGGERLFAMTLDGPYAKELVKIDASEEGIDQLIDLVQGLRDAYLEPLLDAIADEERAASEAAVRAESIRSELLAAGEHAEVEAVDVEVASQWVIPMVPDPIPLIVLDSMATFAPPKVEETDNFAMTRVYDQLRRLASQTRGVVLVLNHVSKADHRGGEFPPDILTFARGGTAQGAAARVNCVFRRIVNTWIGIVNTSIGHREQAAVSGS